jgi:hypothetical protein
MLHVSSKIIFLCLTTKITLKCTFSLYFCVTGILTVFLTLRKEITHIHVRDFDKKIALRKMWAQEPAVI